MTTKHRIETPLAPPPRPQFSQGVRRGSVVQTAGQVGVDPVTGEFGADVAAQTTLALQAIDAILTEGGATFDDVVMLRVYLKHGDDFDVMNEAYDGFVPSHTPSGMLPARTTVVTAFASEQILVEIDALAVTD
ncbi:MAG: RidA family protein [Microbacteriaceae bacterium]